MGDFLNIAVISNGTILDYNRIKGIIKKEYDYIICADGGSRHAYEMAIIPDLIVGDLDSISEEIIDYYKSQNVDIKTFPSEKDQTDTQLAIDMAIEKYPMRIGLFGCTGNRLDHTLSNINHLFYIKEKNTKGILIDDHNEIILADTINTIEGKEGDTVSLVSISDKTEDITLQGFKYPLFKAVVLRGDSIGISNELKCEKGIIQKGKGELLVIKSRD